VRMLVVTVCETMECAVFKVNSPNQTVLTGRNNNRLMPPTRFHPFVPRIVPGRGKRQKQKERRGIRINSVPAFPKLLACEWSGAHAAD